MATVPYFNHCMSRGDPTEMIKALNNPAQWTRVGVPSLVVKDTGPQYIVIDVLKTRSNHAQQNSVVLQKLKKKQTAGSSAQWSTPEKQSYYFMILGRCVVTNRMVAVVAPSQQNLNSLLFWAKRLQLVVGESRVAVLRPELRGRYLEGGRGTVFVSSVDPIVPLRPEGDAVLFPCPNIYPLSDEAVLTALHAAASGGSETEQQGLETFDCEVDPKHAQVMASLARACDCQGAPQSICDGAYPGQLHCDGCPSSRASLDSGAIVLVLNFSVDAGHVPTGVELQGEVCGKSYIRYFVAGDTALALDTVNADRLTEAVKQLLTLMSAKGIKLRVKGWRAVLGAADESSLPAPTVLRLISPQVVSGETKEHLQARLYKNTDNIQPPQSTATGGADAPLVAAGPAVHLSFKYRSTAPESFGEAHFKRQCAGQTQQQDG